MHDSKHFALLSSHAAPHSAAAPRGICTLWEGPAIAVQDSGEHLALTHGHGIGADILVTYQMSDVKTVFLPPHGMVGGNFPTYVRLDKREGPR